MDSHQIGKLATDTFERYQDVRAEAQERMGAEELTNDEFVDMLVFVYQLHLESA